MSARLRLMFATMAGVLCGALVLVALPAAAQDGTTARWRLRHDRAADRLGAGAEHPEPVRRPGRGGLHRLGAQLGPADQLQREGPEPGAGDRRELGGLRGSQDGDDEAGPRPEVVRRQADHLRGRQVVARRARRPRHPLHELHVEHHEDRHARSADGRHPHQAAGRPDRRRPLHLRAAQAHLGQGPARRPEGPVQAEAAARRQRPLHGHRLRDAAGSSRWSGTRTSAAIQGPTTRSSSSSTATRTPSSGRCNSARSTWSARSRPPATPASAPRRTSTRGAARRPPTPSSPSTCARSRTARTPSSTPPSRTRPCGRRSPTRSTASKLQEIATRGTSFVANGILPSYYKAFYEEPEQTYPYDPDLANQMLDDAGWTRNSDGIREKDGETLSFDVYVRSESPFTVQMAKLIAEMTKEIGVEFKVQVVSTDKLYDLTVRKVDGKPAPDFDTFIWGWGGDPYDPSFLLSILTSGRDRRLLRLVLLEPRVRQALQGADRGSSTPTTRREVIKQMVDITQDDLPYLVLTEDPAAAGLSDRQDRARSSRSARRRPGISSAIRSPTRACSPSIPSPAPRPTPAAATPAWPGSSGSSSASSAGCSSPAAAAAASASRWSCPSEARGRHA